MTKQIKNRWVLPLAYFSLALIVSMFAVRALHPSTHGGASNKQAVSVILMMIVMACMNVIAGTQAYKAWTMNSSDFANWSGSDMLSNDIRLWSIRLFAPIGFVITLCGLIWTIILILTGWISFKVAW